MRIRRRGGEGKGDQADDVAEPARLLLLSQQQHLLLLCRDPQHPARGVILLVRRHAGVPCHELLEGDGAVELGSKL